MLTVPFVSINGTLYTVAKYIENVTAELGPYKVYKYDKEKGDQHTGMYHPGTVTVQSFKRVCSCTAVRKKTGATPSDFAKLELGKCVPNDNVINYLIHEKVITKADLDVHQVSLNIFNEVAVNAIIGELNADLNIKLPLGRVRLLPRSFSGCILTPILIQPKEKRVKRALF